MKVKIKDKYTDVCFCTNHSCTIKTCYRHVCHNSNEHRHSEAHFENTEKCEKKIREDKKNENRF